MKQKRLRDVSFAFASLDTLLLWSMFFLTTILRYFLQKRLSGTRWLGWGKILILPWWRIFPPIRVVRDPPHLLPHRVSKRGASSSTSMSSASALPSRPVSWNPRGSKRPASPSSPRHPKSAFEAHLAASSKKVSLQIGVMSLASQSRRLFGPPLVCLEVQGCETFGGGGLREGLLYVIRNTSPSLSGSDIGEVIALMAKGVVGLAPPSPEYYSHLFVIWKASGCGGQW